MSTAFTQGTPSLLPWEDAWDVGDATAQPAQQLRGTYNPTTTKENESAPQRGLGETILDFISRPGTPLGAARDYAGRLGSDIEAGFSEIGHGVSDIVDSGPSSIPGQIKGWATGAPRIALGGTAALFSPVSAAISPVIDPVVAPAVQAFDTNISKPIERATGYPSDITTEVATQLAFLGIAKGVHAALPKVLARTASEAPWALPWKKTGDEFHIDPEIAAAIPEDGGDFQTTAMQRSRGLGRSPLAEPVMDRTQEGFDKQFGEPKLQRIAGLAQTPQDIMATIRDNPKFEALPDANKQEIADYYQRLRNGENPKTASSNLSDATAEVLGRPVAMVDGKRISRAELLTPQQEIQHDALIRSTISALREIAPRADIKAFARIDKGHGKGAYFTTPEGRALVGFALESNEGQNLDTIGTGRHEVGHWLLDKTAKPHEKQAIFDLANASNWREKHNIEARYPNETEAKKTEEAVVEEFRAGRPWKWQGYPRLVRAAFMRFHGLLTKIQIAAQAVVGKKATGEQVMRLMESGAMGRRKVVSKSQIRSPAAEAYLRGEPPL